MDQATDRLLDAAQVRAVVAEVTGRPPHPDTVRRWMAEGLTVRGKTVVMGGVRFVGVKRIVPESQVRAFLRAITTEPTPPAPAETPTQRQRRERAAHEELQRLLGRRKSPASSPGA